MSAYVHGVLGLANPGGQYAFPPSGHTYPVHSQTPPSHVHVLQPSVAGQLVVELQPGRGLHALPLSGAPDELLEDAPEDPLEDVPDEPPLPDVEPDDDVEPLLLVVASPSPPSTEPPPDVLDVLLASLLPASLPASAPPAAPVCPPQETMTRALDTRMARLRMTGLVQSCYRLAAAAIHSVTRLG
jgi:hypothetical protein